MTLVNDLLDNGLEETKIQDKIELLADELKRNNFIFTSRYNKGKHIWEANVTIPKPCKVIYEMNRNDLYIEFPRRTLIMCDSPKNVVENINERKNCPWV